MQREVQALFVFLIVSYYLIGDRVEDTREPSAEGAGEISEDQRRAPAEIIAVFFVKRLAILPHLLEIRVGLLALVASGDKG